MSGFVSLIRPAAVDVAAAAADDDDAGVPGDSLQRLCEGTLPVRTCLLYTSDAADE